MTRPRFEIFRGKDNQFYVRLRHPNGRVSFVTEGYTRKDSAQDAIAAIRSACVICDVIECLPEGGHRWLKQRLFRRNVQSAHAHE